MHRWLAFLSAVLVAIGALLLLGAFYGITYQGLDIQMMIAVAVVLLIIAAVVAAISYAGFKAQYTQKGSSALAPIAVENLIIPAFRYV